jgi:hypothetical protein
MVRDVNREPSLIFTRWFADCVCEWKYAPSVNQGRLFLFRQSFTDRHDAQKRLSPCTVLGIVL